MGTTGQPTIDQLARQIGTFDSWYGIMDTLVEITKRLIDECTATTLPERRQFVYGGLVALHDTYGWDQAHQSAKIERQILWMLTQLMVR